MDESLKRLHGALDEQPRGNDAIELTIFRTHFSGRDRKRTIVPANVPGLLDRECVPRGVSLWRL